MICSGSAWLSYFRSILAYEQWLRVVLPPLQAIIPSNHENLNFGGCPHFKNQLPPPKQQLYLPPFMPHFGQCGTNGYGCIKTYDSMLIKCVDSACTRDKRARLFTSKDVCVCVCVCVYFWMKQNRSIKVVRARSAFTFFFRCVWSKQNRSICC